MSGNNFLPVLGEYCVSLGHERGLMDAVTKTRLKKSIITHREKSATFPSLKELEQYGFTKKQVELGVKNKIIEQLYATLTSGAVIKVFKVKID